MVELHVERTIAAPPQRVFDWLTNLASPSVARAGAKVTDAPALPAAAVQLPCGPRRLCEGAGEH